MLNSAVTIINARNLGTTRFLTGSTPSTCSASSSSRILRAPRSAVIAVPATPARITAVTNGANSRTLASTKKPPSRSSEPNRIRKLPACRPGAPYPNATVLTSSGNQHRRSANRNWITNSPPYGYGGRAADIMGLPVKIIMSPTCSSRFFVGRNARSATARTTESQLLGCSQDSDLNLDSFLSSCQDTPVAASPKPREVRAAEGGRLARRKARTVQAILDASERHFLDNGFESAKVDAIAHDADVSVGSLYNHFGGKESLCEAVGERALDLFGTYMDDNRDTDLSALEQTLDTAGRLARFARERPGQMRLLCLVEPTPTNHELRAISAKVAKAMADRERRTAALIEVAIRRGQMRPIGARDAAAFLWSAWKGMLTLGPRAERAAPGRDRELRALLEAGLRIVVGGLASDEAREHDETVRALLESTPARKDREPREAKPLALERAPVANDLRADFPELALWFTEVAAKPADSPAPVKRRMAAAGDRVTGAGAIGTRSESTPWAYRVFARRVGIDPDEAERAVEAAALQQRAPLGGEATGALPDDAQLIAVAETGVPVLAFDADRLDGDLWLRRAEPGDRVGDRALEPGRPVLADRTRVIAVPFGPQAPDAAIDKSTKRMTFVALQVKGVPDVGMEEALWTVVEIVRAAS